MSLVDCNFVETNLHGNVSPEGVLVEVVGHDSGSMSEVESVSGVKLWQVKCVWV